MSEKEVTEVWNVVDISGKPNCYATAKPLQIICKEIMIVENLVKGMTKNNEWMIFAQIPDHWSSFYMGFYSKKQGEVSVTLSSVEITPESSTSELKAFSNALCMKDAGWLLASWLASWVETKEQLVEIIEKASSFEPQVENRTIH